MSATPRPRIPVIAAASLGVLLLSGCFPIPTPPGTAVPDSADPNVDELVEGSGGEVDFESDALPADFPEGDIPLVPGDVGPSMTIADGAAWSITIYAADEATANTAPDLLEAAGFRNDSQVFWEDDTYLVVVVAIQEHDDGRWAVTYQVQTR